MSLNHPNPRRQREAGALPAAEAATAIRCRGIEKTFGAIRALHPVDLDVRQGTIHALVGQNGAGKSTLLGILAGRIAPGAGTIEVFGRREPLGSPRASRNAGVVAIYQELTIVPALSAVANVFLGQVLSTGGFLSERAMRQRFVELSRRLGVTIAPEVDARTLSVADQQILEIMRAVQSDAQIILFDEPTAALAPTERESLFRLMRDLREQGHTMLYVSHNLDEVLGLADVVTVFRNGRQVTTGPVRRWTKGKLVQAMLGEDVGDIYHRRLRQTASCGQAVLRAEAVTVPGAIAGVDVTIEPGEVVGIGGLVGSGRTTVLRALAGLEPQATGRLWIGGEAARFPTTPSAARELGIALAPEDRKLQGLVLGMSAMENIVLAGLQRVTRFGLLSNELMRCAAEQVSSSFRLDPDRLPHPVHHLSGGNQQKALLARWRHCRPRVLLVDEPTRGIDIGAKGEILDALRSFADDGIGVLIVSSELEEVAALADRILVLVEGRLVGHLDARRDVIDVAAILNQAFKVEKAHG
jgi:rhamnose transport system ATP-binding protein